MLLQRLALRAAVACALWFASSPADAFEGRVSWYGSEHGQATRAVASTRRTVGQLAGRYEPEGQAASA